MSVGVTASFAARMTSSFAAGNATAGIACDGADCGEAGCGDAGCDVAANRIEKGELSADLSAPPRVSVREVPLPAPSEAAIIVVESADKIQTRMFRRPRAMRSRCSAQVKARAGPEILPPILRHFPVSAFLPAAQKTGQFCPDRQTLPPAAVTGCVKSPDFPDRNRPAAMAWGLRHRLPATKHLEDWPVSLNGIAASALSALKTNSAALGVVSNNVANLNTPGYARRVVNEQTLSAGGQLMGVDIASVQRVVDQFLQQENLLGQRQRPRNMIPRRACSPSSTACWADRATTSRWPPASPICPRPSPPPPRRRALRPAPPAVLNALQWRGQRHLQRLEHHLLAAEPGRQPGGQFDLLAPMSLIKQIYDLNQQIKTASAAAIRLPACSTSAISR